MAKQVLDVHAGKGMTTSQSNEHLRNANTGERLKKWSGNYDPSREKLNFEVGPGGIIVPVDKKSSIPSRIKKILKQRGVVDPNKGLPEARYRTVANIILGGSRDQMHRLAFGSQKVNLEPGSDNADIRRMPEIESWALDMYKFMSKKYGEKNIVAFIVHLDEKNPHIHCTLLPITEQNKFSWRKVMVGEENSKMAYSRRMTELHNEISQINLSYGLERGDRVAETGARHRTIEQYHQELRKKLQQENEQLSETIEGNQGVIQRQQATLSGLEKDIKHATARFKALQTMITNLESKKNRLLEEVEQLNQARESGKISAEEAKARLEKIHSELREVDEKIADKTQKLHTAERQLDQLQSKTHSAEKKFEEVQQKLQKEVPSLSKTTVKEMQQMGYMMMATDAKRRATKYIDFLSSLPSDHRDVALRAGDILFDGSIAETIMDCAAQVTSIAAALYLGYLDAATRISQSGGGGGSPGTGWGKRDDEDDLAFRQRCFFMALHMMRPAQKQQRKR